MPIEGRHWLEWTPYDESDVIVFDSRGEPFVLQNLGNFSSNLLAAIARSTPGQLGTTLIGLSADARALQIGITVSAEEQNREDYWEKRDQLIAALATPLPRPGQDVSELLGTLKLYRPGKPVVKVLGVPIGSPRETGRPDPTSVAMDIVWYCPEPYWRPEEETESALAANATTFPLTFPLVLSSLNIEVDVDNVGHVDVPMVARIYGEVVNPRLRNAHTGEAFVFDYTVDEGDYIEISTHFGNKYVELVHPDGSRENLLGDGLVLAETTWWYLRRGLNVVRFEADNNISGHAELDWSPRYAGV